MLPSLPGMASRSISWTKRARRNDKDRVNMEVGSTIFVTSKSRQDGTLEVSQLEVDWQRPARIRISKYFASGRYPWNTTISEFEFVTIPNGLVAMISA